MSETGQQGEKSVVIEREFAARVDVVWRLWTEPSLFAEWYGPTGATIPVAEMDVRPGGARRIAMAMETPNGPMTMWFVGDYREVAENQRLVYSEAMADEAGNHAPGHPDTVVTVEFEDLGESTRIVLTHDGVPAGSPGEMGWQMALDSLAERLAAHE